MKWRKIETAPMDGTVIDLYAWDGECGFRLPECYWDENSECWRTIDDELIVDGVSHWMPEPNAPKETK